MEALANFFPFKGAGHGRLKKSQKKQKTPPVYTPRRIALFILVVGIVLLASFMRLYRIGDYLTFLGDEGRDVLIVKDIVEGFGALVIGDFHTAGEKLTLLGPRASAADFFTGPLYYYLMAPFLFAFHFDPVGPAVMVALIGIATVFLIYHVSKRLLDEKAALFAAALYAVSPLVIAYSRSSWNPNPMPFVSLLLFYLLYKAVQSSSLQLFLFVGILLGVAMELHYMATFVGVIVFFFIGLGKYYQEKKVVILPLLKEYLTVFFGFLIGMSPFLVFEIKHGFPNTTTIFNFIFSNSVEQDYETGGSFFSVGWNVFFRLFSRLILRFPPPEQVNFTEDIIIMAWQWIVLAIAAMSMVGLFKIKNRLFALLLALWLGLGIFQFGFYKKPIYDYYFAFMFPLPFMLLGNGLSVLARSKKWEKMRLFLSLLIFSGIFIFNILGAPFFFEPNRQKDQVKMIAEFVLSKTQGKPYNFALITGGNSDHGYRYFFELNNQNPVLLENIEKDPERKSVTTQLLIVCEDLACNPLGNSQWEIAGFGRAEIADEWDVKAGEVVVVKVIKMVPYSEIPKTTITPMPTEATPYIPQVRPLQSPAIDVIPQNE